MFKIKITKIFTVALTLIVLSFTTTNAQEKSTLKVDPANSSINWKGYKPTGSHNGTIKLVSGNLIMDNGSADGGSFTVDMLSIKDADGSAKLEGHLKSKDFFEIEVYPTSTFQITSSENKEGKFFVTGNITIKGITKQITFPATVTVTSETVTLKSAIIKINRAEFNIKYKSKSFFNNLKEKFINDEFDFQVTIAASK